MSGENDLRPSSWTTDTLMEYVKQRFKDQDKAVQAALQAAKEAVLKAETAADKRFDAVNEFRQTLSDQTATFLPRPEYDAQHKALEEKVNILTDRMNQDKGGEVNMAKIYAAIATVGTILAIVVLIANNVFK